MENKNKENFFNLSDGEIAGLTIGSIIGLIIIIFLILVVVVIIKRIIKGSKGWRIWFLLIFVIFLIVLISIGIIVGINITVKKNNKKFSNLSGGEVVK